MLNNFQMNKLSKLLLMTNYSSTYIVCDQFLFKNYLTMAFNIYIYFFCKLKKKKKKIIHYFLTHDLNINPSSDYYIGSRYASKYEL